MCSETEVTFSAQRVKGRGEKEMVGSSQSSSVKRSSEDKQPSRLCIRGSFKISWLVSRHSEYKTRQEPCLPETRKWSPPSKEIKS